VGMKQRRTQLRRALAVDVTGGSVGGEERVDDSECGSSGRVVMGVARRAGRRCKSKWRVRLS
jgi:hypothetical protein